MSSFVVAPSVFRSSQDLGLEPGLSFSPCCDCVMLKTESDGLPDIEVRGERRLVCTNRLTWREIVALYRLTVPATPELAPRA
jgi:hypothetical protein